MSMNNKYVVVGVVIAILISLGAGVVIGKMGLQQAEQNLSKAAQENQTLKKQVDALTVDGDAAKKELADLKSQAGIKSQEGNAPALEPYMLESMKRAGISDPSRLIEDLKQNPSVIPEEAVLGGTMGFTQVALINEHWVYGSYEDGHIAGAAIFQWEVKDSAIIWTPVLVYKE